MRSGPRNEPFVTHHVRYDEWFERHRAAYLSELLAVRVLLPWNGRGLEIGVGTGRFAGPLGVEFGIDPAVEMLGYARARGVCVVRAVAEALPFARAVFDYALIVTTICFVEDAAAMLAEAHRVLKPGGELVIGLSTAPAVWVNITSTIRRRTCFTARRILLGRRGATTPA